MTRVWWPLLVLLATAGAGPNRTLPVPPIPPTHPPPDRSAPVPDRDAVGPVAPAKQGTKVTVEDFRVEQLNTQGLAYSRGSQFQSPEDKRPIQTPGLTVRVPLQLQ